MCNLLFFTIYKCRYHYGTRERGQQHKDQATRTQEDNITVTTSCIQRIPEYIRHPRSKFHCRVKLLIVGLSAHSVKGFYVGWMCTEVCYAEQCQKMIGSCELLGMRNDFDT